MRHRGNANTVLLILILLILGGAAVGAYYIYRNVASVKLLPWLSEEIGDKPVLTMATLSSIEPGQVYQVVGDKHGWQIREKDTKLYEKLVLNNVDLSVNDVIAPHLYDAVVVYAGDPSNKYDSAHIYFENATTSYLDLPPDVTVACLGQFKYAPGFYTDDSYAFGIFTLQAHWGISLAYAVEGTAFNQWTTLYKTIQFPPLINPPFYDNMVYFWFQKDYQNENITTITWKDELGNVKSISKDLSTDANLAGRFGNGKVAVFYVTIFNRKLTAGDPTTGRIAFLAVYNGLFDPEIGSGDNLLLLFDPTMYNGTHYFLVAKDPSTGAQIPYEMTSIKYVERLPAERTFMLHISRLATDNKLHFMYFPEGSIIQIKDQNGNLIRKFTVTGTPINNDKQIEDYTINLNTSLVSQATVEAWVPSQKVRVYGPYGATIQIVDANGVVVGEARIQQSYVDIPLMGSIANGQIIIQADEKAENNLDIQVKLNGDKLDITVFDSQGTPVPGVLVRVADPSGVVIAANQTDQSGSISIPVDRPLPSATIEVSGIWKNQLVYQSKEFTFTSSEQQQVNTTSNNMEQVRLWLLGAFLLILLAAVVIFTTRGIRVRI